MAQLGQQWKNFFAISEMASEEERRGKLLHIFLIAMLIIVSINLLGLVLEYSFSFDTGKFLNPLEVWGRTTPPYKHYIFANICVFSITLIAYILLRSGKATLAAIIFVTAIEFGLFISDRPIVLLNEQSTLYFAIPIVIASLLLRPVAGFILVVLTLVVLIGLGLVVGVMPHWVALEGFAFVVLPVWLMISLMNRAIYRLSEANRSLTVRMAYEHAEVTLLHQLEGKFDSAEEVAAALKATLLTTLKAKHIGIWMLSADNNLRLVDSHGISNHLERLVLLDAQTLANIRTHGDTLRQIEVGGIVWDLGLALQVDDVIVDLLLLNLPNPTDHDLRFLRRIMSWISANLAKEREKSRTMRLLLEHEQHLRRQTAADLHDGIITKQIRWLMRNIETQAAPEILLTGVEVLTQDLRRIIQSRLDPLGPNQQMLSAVEYYIFEAKHRASQIEMHLDKAHRPRWNTLAADVQIDLYFAIQEAIENAIKADPSACINLRFECEDSLYRIIIEDQGPGFDAHLLRNGRGLSHLHSRMQHCGGTAQIESRIGEGTVVTLEVRETIPTKLTSG